MRNPTRWRLKKSIISDRDLTNIHPRPCEFPWKFGKAHEFIFENNIKVIRQRFKGLTFYMDQYEITVDGDQILPYNIVHENIYLVYNLGLGFEVLNQKEKVMRTIGQNSFYPSYNCTSNGLAKFKKGTTVLLFISFRSEWTKTFNSIPELSPLLEALTKRQDEPLSLLDLPISKDELKELEALLGLETEHLGTLYSAIDDTTTNSLIAYEKQSIELSQTYWHEVRQYIEDNFRKEKIDFKLFADKFCMELRALNYNFKKNYHRTPDQYFLFLKMKEARRLIRLDDGTTLTAIAEHVGYPSSNFSTQYKRTFGYPPSDEGLYD